VRAARVPGHEDDNRNAEGEGDEDARRHPRTIARKRRRRAGRGRSEGGDRGAQARRAGCEADFETWTVAAATGETRPINCVTWYEAFAFCAWDGGRLPTEAERYYAAAGGSEARYYPWLSPPTDATISERHPAYDCTADGSRAGECAGADLLPVGMRPAGNGKWGRADLGGNVWEWVLDVFADYGTPCADCAALSGGPDRAVPGGGFNQELQQLRTAVRTYDEPTMRKRALGFRCARSP
jgi:formylglycine-generating enzyme